MNTLQRLLNEKIDKWHLSMRAAAKQIGIAHTTLIRIINGEKCDMPTLQKMAEWLGVTPSSLLDTLDTDDTATNIAAVLSAEPALAKVFNEALQRVKSGKMTQAELKDFISYAAFRFGIGKEDNSS